MKRGKELIPPQGDAGIETQIEGTKVGDRYRKVEGINFTANNKVWLG